MKKLILPQEIIEKIKSKCPIPPERDDREFQISDLATSLTNYIKSLPENNKALFYRFESVSRSVRTLGFALSREGKKEDGAVESLRDLLCFFAFNDSFELILKQLRVSIEKVISETIELKSNYNPENIYVNDFYRNRKNVYSQKELQDRPHGKIFASKIYFELKTRKAAIPIDENNDLIEEIYDSWYDLFRMVRNELKMVSEEYVNDNDKIISTAVELSINLLNETLRPHLTEHQAKFRAWFQNEKSKPKNKNIAPQELQKKHPDYDSIIKSMQKVNKKLIDTSKKFNDLIK